MVYKKRTVEVIFIELLTGSVPCVHFSNLTVNQQLSASRVVHTVFSLQQFHCMSLRIERSKTSSAKTAPGTQWTLCFCWEVALYMLSDWTLYVALCRSCPYCMRCSEWKWGLKGHCILSRRYKGPFWSHSSLKGCTFSTPWTHLMVLQRLI